MKMSAVIVPLLFGALSFASQAQTLCPDGTYVGGDPRLAPDGTYVGSDSD